MRAFGTVSLFSVLLLALSGCATFTRAEVLPPPEGPPPPVLPVVADPPSAVTSPAPPARPQRPVLGPFVLKGLAWKMPSAEALKEYPRASVVDPGVYFIGEDTIGGLDASMGFVTVNEVVARISFFLRERHSDESGHVRDFERLRALLVEKYGVPDSDETLWRNPLFRDEPSKLGLAIAAGHVSRWCEWQLDDTVVRLSLRGDNYKVSLGVDYRSRELEAALEEQRKQKKLNDL